MSEESRSLVWKVAVALAWPSLLAVATLLLFLLAWTLLWGFTYVP